jgi:lysyl-tRNA synthetase, class II
MSGDAEKPDSSDLLAERRGKLERLRESGVDPFPHDFDDREEIAAVRERHEGLEAGTESGESVRAAGRITARRGHGKAAFIDLRDRSGQLQLHSRADVLGDDSHERLIGLDVGDFVGVEGEVFASRRGELSIRVDDWWLLSKSLRPLPSDYYGLEDTETRYRRRELDLIANPEVREMFEARARTIAEVRSWLDAEGFLEVETPVLQPLYGGALARPFTTHHNALDRDLYLRIATELYLKRLIIGGIERVYELGKDFRNEGVSHKHNPEFTMLEWYEAYADYDDAARRLEALVSQVAQAVLGTTTIERDGEKIDLAPPWRRVTLRDAISERTGIDIAAKPSREELAGALGREPEPDEGWGKLVDALLSKLVEPELTQPTFVLDYPVELSPFAKRHRAQEGFVERWEAFMGGIEIANAFSELNDPDEQRRRFEAQREETARGDEEAQPFDEAFIEALEYGMPPTAGVGLGIDRLVMLMTGAKTLREVVLFPAMRT